MSVKSFFTSLWGHRKLLILLITPFIGIPFLIPGTKIGYAAYILWIMAVYWVTEALPIPITALLPIIMAPMFCIMTSSKICSAYIKDSSMLFVGGLMVAAAVENWNLHKRMALGVLLFVGAKPRWLMLGFMLPTWFLSMWISNVAATAMMLPIVDAVLKELSLTEMESCRRKSISAGNLGVSPIMMTSIETHLNRYSEQESVKPNYLACDETAEHSVTFNHSASVTDNNDNISHQEDNTKIPHLALAKAMTVAIAYAASCGGIGTITGTGPNLIVNGLVNTKFGAIAGLNFGTWMLYAVPISLICVLFIWLYLQIWFFGIKKFTNCKSNPSEDKQINLIIRQAYNDLGDISFAQISTCVLFILLIILWLSREPGVPGWAALFTVDHKSFVTDTQPAILIAIIMFTWPSYNIFKKNRDQYTQLDADESQYLLTWKMIQTTLPWSIILLLGGGFALAEICDDSGLSKAIGEQLEVLQHLPVGALVFLVSLGTAMLTEITSNTATATILLPILSELAKCIGVHPFMLMLPCTVSASFAFCLPVATPPNALVFSKGYISIPDMIKVGIALNIFCVAIVTAATLTYGSAFFNMQTYPSWAGECSHNQTAV